MEARERPPLIEPLQFTTDSDIEAFMRDVESKCTNELYSHARTPACTPRGKNTTLCVQSSTGIGDNL